MRRTFRKHPWAGNFSYFNSLKVFCLFVSCSKDIWWYFGKQLKVLVNFGKKYPLKFFGHINRVHSVLRSRFSQIAVKTIVIFYLGSNTQTAICLIAFCYLDLESKTNLFSIDFRWVIGSFILASKATPASSAAPSSRPSFSLEDTGLYRLPLS